MSQETLELIHDIETVVFGIVVLGGAIALCIAAAYNPNKARKKKKAS